MSRARVAICALVAAFAFGALAAPALAKKEIKREFEASGTAKLSSAANGGQQFTFPFEEKGSIKMTCGSAEGRGEVVPTEGKATSFTDKVKYGSCLAKFKKKFVELTMAPVEFEFHSNGTASILNEVKVTGPLGCTIFLEPQTIGAEAVEEGKKGPETYTTLGEGNTRRVEVTTKTHTHSEGEEGGFEFEQEEGRCGEFKVEGGKYKGKMTVTASSPKESWIAVHEETIILPKE